MMDNTKTYYIKYFTWQELTHTDTNLPNVPNDINVIANLIKLANTLDTLRTYFGKPILVNSGYRSKEVNEKVGGVKTSHHLFGFAADITSKTNLDELKEAVITYKNYFDQIIIYPNFIHVSVAPQMRHQVIIKTK